MIDLKYRKSLSQSSVGEKWCDGEQEPESVAVRRRGTISVEMTTSSKLPQVRDVTLFASSHARVGRFNCPADAPEITRDQYARVPYVSFPLSTWRVTRSRSRSYVADPGLVTVWSGREEFRRLPMSPFGVSCAWLCLPTEFGTEASDELCERLGERPFIAAPPRLSLRLRRLLRQLESGAISPAIDALEIEEQALTLGAEVLGLLAGERPVRENESQRDLAERTRLLLASDLEGKHSLQDLAQRLYVSPFHLCRVFRREVGVSIHAYRVRLRLLVALDRLEHAPSDLSELALDLGFASHSHFTSAFRKHFGLAPSQWASGERWVGSLGSRSRLKAS